MQQNKHIKNTSGQIVLRRLKYNLLRLGRSGPDRIIELLLTAAIAFFALVQWTTTDSNNSSTARQTDQLITAAKISAYAASQNVEASRNFADSAQHINQGISRAVGRLQEQANATESLRASSENQSVVALNAATENSRSDLRAYIVTSLDRAEVIRVGCPNDYPQQRPCVMMHFSNVGRTPAVAIDVKAFLHVDQTGDETGIAEEDQEHMKVGRYTGLEGGVLANSAPGSFYTTPIDPPSNHPCTSYHGPACGHTVFGLIRYKDIFGEIHETGFCTFFQDEPPMIVRSCNRGNWFDVRPSEYKLVEGR